MMSTYCSICETHQDTCEYVASPDGFVYKICEDCRRKLGVSEPNDERTEK